MQGRAPIDSTNLDHQELDGGNYSKLFLKEDENPTFYALYSSAQSQDGQCIYLSADDAYLTTRYVNRMNEEWSTDDYATQSSFLDQPWSESVYSTS